jgi:hypothetical protein
MLDRQDPISMPGMRAGESLLCIAVLKIEATKSLASCLADAYLSICTKISEFAGWIFH